MPENTHWPFSGGSNERERHADQHSKLDSQRARAANQAAFRQRLRNDRLLVGGRAHVKKAGLS